jgi:hypothetical protein
MAIKPNIQLMIAVIKVAELFLQELEQIEESYLREISLISEKRDGWKIKLDARYKNEIFGREIILHVSVPEIEVKLISDEQIK